MPSVKPAPLIATCLVCVGEALHIIGLATTYWLESKINDGHMGLFKQCAGDTCVEYKEIPSELKGVIAMTILGMLCGLVGMAFVLYFIYFLAMGKSPPVLAAFGGFMACVAAFIFIVIGIVVYAVKIYHDDFGASSSIKFGYSFALCIVGAVLMPLGGCLAYLSGRSMVA